MSVCTKNTKGVFTHKWPVEKVGCCCKFCLYMSCRRNWREVPGGPATLNNLTN